jgi:hypothetical protein
MILDKNGNPIRPKLQHALVLELATTFKLMSKPSESLAAARRVEALRQSCGLGPKLIKFRRSLPYDTEA